MNIFKGIIKKDCAESSHHYRNELIKLGMPKDTLLFGVLNRTIDNAEHVVLIVDVTKQITIGDWNLTKVKP